MDLSDVILQAAVFIAAFLQSVTGIGFGMVAGPVILVLLNDSSAIVISTLMSWLIAAVLLPMLWRGTDRRMLGRLMAGAVVGLPFGLWLLTTADVPTLKIAAGLVIGLATSLMVFGAPGMGRPGLAGDVAAGGLAGVFGSGLAMPGPTAAVRLGALGLGKVRVRATMFSFFCCVWPVIFAGQVLTAGITSATAWNALSLVPATLVGLGTGHLAAGRVSEQFFRRLVMLILVATSAMLLLGSIREAIGGV